MNVMKRYGLRAVVILAVLMLSAGFLPLPGKCITFSNITMDGDLSDWAQDEEMGTSSSSTFLLTWNASHLSLGLSDQDWEDQDGGEDGDLMIYLDTTPGGTRQSVNWDGTNTLPFEADYLFALEDGFYHNLRLFNQSTGSWEADQHYTGTVYSGNSGNNDTEISIPWSDLADPAYLGIMAFGKWENANNVWGAWPTDNPTGGGPLTFTKYYFFPRLVAGISPGTALVLTGGIAEVVDQGEDADTNTAWADVYPGTSADNDAGSQSDGSSTAMTFYYTLDGGAPTLQSARVDGMFDGQNGINGNNDKYYAIIPANRGQTVKWFASANGSNGASNSTTARSFVSNIPFWIGSQGSNPDTNTMWAEMNPGTSSDNNQATQSDGSATSMTFYYTADGSVPTLQSARLTGIFDGQNGTHGNNDKYYAIVPASYGQRIRWFALGNASNGAHNVTVPQSFISKSLDGYAWLGGEGTDPDTNTVWADVYPGTSNDDNAATISNGADTAMKFFYTLDGTAPTEGSPWTSGIFDGQNATHGNNDKYYAIIPASRGQTVKWFARGNSSTGGSNTSGDGSFISNIPVEESWVGSEGSDPSTNTVWADVYPGSSADDAAGTVSDGSQTGMVFHYTLDGTAPNSGSPNAAGIFDGQNGTYGNNDRYYAILPAEDGQTVRWYTTGTGAETAPFSGNVQSFGSDIGTDVLDTDEDGIPDTMDDDDDGDGMPDHWERKYGLDPLSEADGAGDPDQDGLSNLAEYLNGTFPDDADTDGDGMPDGWEVEQDLDPGNDVDAALDRDLDGLDNLGEFTSGTDLDDPDTDGDEMKDGWEARYGLDPLRKDAGEDEDGDGLTNLEESMKGTEPNNEDTDGDGMPDGWEAEAGLDPVAANGLDDEDNDGFSNLAEYENGTDPSDASSHPAGSGDDDDVEDDDDTGEDDDTSGDDDTVDDDDDDTGDADDDDASGDDDNTGDDDTSGDDDSGGDDTGPGDDDTGGDGDETVLSSEIPWKVIGIIGAVAFLLLLLLGFLIIRLRKISGFNLEDGELAYDEEEHLDEYRIHGRGDGDEAGDDGDGVKAGRMTEPDDDAPGVRDIALGSTGKGDEEMIEELEELFGDFMTEGGTAGERTLPEPEKKSALSSVGETGRDEITPRKPSALKEGTEKPVRRVMMKPRTGPVGSSSPSRASDGGMDHSVVKIFDDE